MQNLDFLIPIITYQNNVVTSAGKNWATSMGLRIR